MSQAMAAVLTNKELIPNSKTKNGLWFIVSERGKEISILFVYYALVHRGSY